MTKNINLFGGPGIGKSTLASGLFHVMKNADKKVELIHEFAKELTYGDDGVRLSDQLLLLGEQHHRLFRLREKVDYTISDSPFVMGLVYQVDDGYLPATEFANLAVRLFKGYNNLNVLLKRDLSEHTYQDYGRDQTLAEAIAKDDQIRMMLNHFKIPYIEVEHAHALETIIRML